MSNDDNEKPSPLERLVAALAEQGDPPCTTCPQRTFCAEEEAACIDYGRWINTGTIGESHRAPSPAIKQVLEDQNWPADFGGTDIFSLFAILHAEAVALDSVDGLYVFGKSRLHMFEYTRWLRDRHVKPLTVRAIREAMRLRGCLA